MDDPWIHHLEVHEILETLDACIMHQESHTCITRMAVAGRGVCIQHNTMHGRCPCVVMVLHDMESEYLWYLISLFIRSLDPIMMDPCIVTPDHGIAMHGHGVYLLHCSCMHHYYPPHRSGGGYVLSSCACCVTLLCHWYRDTQYHRIMDPGYGIS